MTDVRLTATTTEGEVVPVLSNTKGELLLEAPIAPPEFDGNLDGDLTVNGDSTFTGGISTDGQIAAKSSIYTILPDSGTIGLAIDYTGHSGGNTFQVTGAGEAKFTGQITATNADFATDFNGIGDTFTVSASQNGIYQGHIAYDSNADLTGYAVDFTDQSPIPEKWKLSRDGTAKFKGDVDATNGTGIARLNPIGQVYIQSNTGVAVDIRSTANLSNSRITLATSGDAEFTGDVIVGSRNKLWMLIEQGGLCHLVEQTTSSFDEALPYDNDKDYPKLRDVFAELDLIEQALNTVMEKLKMTPPAGWEVWDGSDNSQ